MSATSEQIVKGQDYRIVLDTGIDLTTATVLKILYKKPGNTKGEWTATITGTTSMYYDVLSTENDKDKIWSFEAYAVIGGRKYYGVPVSVTIINNIK